MRHRTSFHTGSRVSAADPLLALPPQRFTSHSLTTPSTVAIRFAKAKAGRLRREHVPASDSLLFAQVKGNAAVRAIHPVLVQLAHASEQSDSMEDLSYFLDKPGLMRRTPRLVLMRESANHNQPGPELNAALLVHEFRPLGMPTGIYAPTDRSGRGVVLGAAEQRLALALRAADQLMATGARMVMMTVQGASDINFLQGWNCSVRGIQWAVRARHQPSHLQLSATYEQTLARLGQKTRANLRYYRRRAEQELNCRFLPAARITPAELLAFNRESSFPLPERVLLWRHKVQAELRSPYMMGLQDGEGRWLSLIAGRRFGNSTEILWQLNRSGLQRHSIVTAMRSYQMEHEIAGGMQRFYVEGGTNHSMQHSFETVPTTDIVMLRRGLKAGMRGFAKRYVPTDNVLAEMLNDPANDWHCS